MKYIQFKIIFLLLIGVFVQNGLAEVYLNTKKEPKIVIFDTPEPKEKIEIKKAEKIEKKTEEQPKKKEPLALQKEEKKDIEILNIPKKVEEKKIEPKKIEEKKVEQIAPKIENKGVATEKIALIYASAMVGKYGIDATNVASTYLLEIGGDFSLEVFDIEKEEKNTIFTLLDTLGEKEITKVIFLLTDKNVWILNNYPNINQFKFYLPLVHKSNVAYPKSNFIYGGIDYKEQFTILTKNKNLNLIEIYDESTLSTNLHNELLKLNIPNLSSLQIKGKIPNYAPLFAKKNEINKSAVILNTSIVKSAINLSILRTKGIVPKETLSTQINYSPVGFHLFQEEDKENFFIVNSIGELPKRLDGALGIFGNDMNYNWVNYSVVLGLEYFTTKEKKLRSQIEIKENQIIYNPKLFSISGGRFIEVKR